MSKTSKLFTKQTIDVQNRSGFDLSHENFLTMTVGTLIPILCEECLPNETYDLGYLSQIQLPPMAADFYGRVDLRLEAFFVPNRIIWGGWQDFMTMPVNNPYSGTPVRPTHTPNLNITNNVPTNIGRAFENGTLADYLGIKASMVVSDGSGVGSLSVPNILPFLAYHKIYDDWYRNSKIQNPVFIRPAAGANTVNQSRYTPYVNSTLSLPSVSASNLNDGHNLFDLRQRNWAKDYYTTAALYPQASGDMAGSTITTDESGTLSIGALRAANTLQRWLDRNNVAGERYADQIKATYGCYPSDSTTDRAIFIGSSTVGIYNKSVYTTVNSEESFSRTRMGASAGYKAANSQGLGDGQLIDSFKTTEHGYIIVLASIVPHATYSTGTRRIFLHSKIGDFANPLLQGMGEQAISDIELTNRFPTDPDDKGQTFGYQQQYSEYKYHDDEVHGLLRDGASLESFCLQRSFDAVDAPSLTTDFIQIPKDYMNQVTTTNDAMSEYGAWANFYLSLKKVSPLSEYVIPTLGDLKDTHKEEVPYRGTML